MTKTTRNTNYKDVSFCDTDTGTIVNNLIAGYEKIVGRTLASADPVRIFILWVADIIAQERVIINESAKMNLPRYSTGDFLDSLGELFFDTKRLEAQYAVTTLEFTIATTLEDDYIISEPTQVTADGEVIFETVAPIVFLAGSDTAVVDAKCTVTGIIGNEYLPGAINKMVNEQFLYYKSVKNTIVSNGGSEREEDDDYYERMRSAAESFSTAGPKTGYEYFAKSVSSLISDVKAESTEDGIADIRVMLQNGELPPKETLDKIQEALSAEDVRPMTDKVQVKAPDVVKFNINATYYLPSDKTESTEELRAKMKEAEQSYILWQTEKMGRDINPSKLEYLLMAAGAKRVEISQPIFTTVDKRSVAVVETSSVLYGGAEDE